MPNTSCRKKWLVAAQLCSYHVVSALAPVLAPTATLHSHTAHQVGCPVLGVLGLHVRGGLHGTHPTKLHVCSLGRMGVGRGWFVMVSS